MKKALSYLLSIVIAAIYLVSTMGYGLHECKHDGTQDVVVLFGETPCEYVHSHVGDDGKVYTHAHGVDENQEGAIASSCSCGGCGVSEYAHDDNCCKTIVFSVTQDQNIEGGEIIPVPYSYISFAVLPFVVSSGELYVSHISIEKPEKRLLSSADELYISYRNLRV